jgi:hypothetical protein
MVLEDRPVHWGHLVELG